ncbi:hypothetical protein IX83_06920 [Basilea psittacipulmonis DSM 24701]|uniref:Putative Fis-like DNA-binding protein n=2 Tax=Basilea TaxID=1472344 RepID=A0A077DIT8_9BURK|nr:hypothetical protein IX83_06920 [Basilea psittacipulmonis DSM 24701]
MKTDQDLSKCVRSSLENYFGHSGSDKIEGVWDMVMSCVEKAMLEVVMDKCHDNQTKAAQLLGITRNTLKKKLINHKLIGNHE